MPEIDKDESEDQNQLSCTLSLSLCWGPQFVWYLQPALDKEVQYSSPVLIPDSEKHFWTPRKSRRSFIFSSRISFFSRYLGHFMSLNDVHQFNQWSVQNVQNASCRHSHRLTSSWTSSSVWKHRPWRCFFNLGNWWNSDSAKLIL
jgi:hypothetical protein